MDVDQIIRECGKQNVELTIEDGQLEVYFEKLPTDHLITLLRDNKPALIDYLQEFNENCLSVSDKVAVLNEIATPLSYQQKRFWFIDQLEKENSQYNIPLSLELIGDVNPDWVAQSLRLIISRHHVLRSTYSEDGSTQHVQDPFAFALEVIDLRGQTQDAIEKQLSDLTKATATKAFNLKQDLMLRASLVNVSDDKCILLLVVHHIACDGTSLSLLLNEFGHGYTAFSANQAPELPPMEIQYSDYATWLVENSDILTKNAQFWMQNLAALPATHTLPLDFPRKKEQDFLGAVESVKLPTALCEQIHKIARRLDVTPFMFLHSALSLLLARWSSSQDILIGSPVAGRFMPQLEPLIGLFVNTLVFRTQLNFGDSFEQLLSQNKAMLLNAYSHQQVPFDLLVERLQPERSLSQSPLFQIMLSFHNQAQADVEIPDIKVNDVTPDQSFIKFDLELSIYEQDQQFVLNWQYATSLFKAKSIQRLANSFEYLLAQITRAPGRQLHCFDIVPEADAMILNDWQSHSIASANQGTVLELFAAQVVKNPEHIAVRFADRALSYRELHQQSDKIAFLLCKKGVVKGDIVAIKMARSTELIVGLLAIMKAGAAYLPIEPSHPKARQQAMVEDSQAKLLLTKTLLDEILIRTETLHDIRLPDVTAQNLAYVLYTSGSTGKPKGVKVHHCNLSHLLDAMDFVLEPPGKWLAVTSVAFDISVFEIFGALSHGFELIVAPELQLSTQSVPDMVKLHQITHIQCTPSFAQLHLTGASAGDCLAPLTTIMVAGEPFTKHLEGALAKVTSAQVYNLYGPTEATIFTSCYPLKNGSSRIPIGKPLAGYCCYVLDSNGAQMPIGVPGELYVAGPGVASGYLNNPELTAQKFIPDSVSGTGTMYATGDIVRWLADGNIEFVGRQDNQIKLRGHRIELGEIEHCITSLAKVEQAVVNIHEFTPNDKRLVAYIRFVDTVTADSDTASLQVLTELTAQLPVYMVPSVVVPVVQMPLTLTGKLDRKALPAPAINGAQHCREITTATEQVLADIWRTQLKLGDMVLGKEENFFGLGGHSLLLVDLLAAIKQRFCVAVSMREVFELSTLTDLAEKIDQLSSSTLTSGKSQPASPAIHRLHLERAPLSYAQQRLWYLDKLKGTSIEYNMLAAYQIEGYFDVDAAEQAIINIIARHEILRTHYCENQFDEAEQVVQHNYAFALSRHDLTDLDGEARKQATAQLLEGEQNTPFNLSAGLMIRGAFILLAEQERWVSGIITVNMHHIASDGWSVAKFISEFVVQYQAFKEGDEAQLPALPVQYSDYTIWQRQVLSGAVTNSQWDFWQKKLQRVPQVHKIPLDRPRPRQQSYEGQLLYQHLGADTLAALNELADKQKATIFMILHSLYALTLAKWSNETDIVIGTPIAGRNQPELESMIGCFLNTLMLRTKLDPNLTFSSYLSQCRHDALDVFAHQNIPFELIVEKLNPERNLAYNPLVQVWFVMHNQEQKMIELPDFSIKTISEEQVTTQFDLELGATVISDPKNPGVVLTWIYCTALFEHETIRLVSEYFDKLLTQVTKTPDTRLADLPGLDLQAQRIQLTKTKIKRRQFVSRSMEKEQ